MTVLISGVPKRDRADAAVLARKVAKVDGRPATVRSLYARRDNSKVYVMTAFTSDSARFMTLHCLRHACVCAQDRIGSSGVVPSFRFRQSPDSSFPVASSAICTTVSITAIYICMYLVIFCAEVERRDVDNAPKSGAKGRTGDRVR